jgi:hypothetical protein
MAKGNLTNLRKFFIIKTLLDCKKWNTQNLIKAVNSSHKYHLILELKKPEKGKKPKAEKPEGRHILLRPDSELVKLEKRHKINNAKISPILNNLVEEGIIAIEPIPKKEKIGRGPGGYRYWLVKDLKNYFYVLKKFNEIYDESSFLFYGLEFIESPFGRFFLNLKIFTSLEARLEVTIDLRIKEYILNIVKMSPNALMQLNKTLDMSPVFEDLEKEEYPEDRAYKLEKNLIKEIIIKNILIILTNSFNEDISNISVKNLSNSPLKSHEHLEVKIVSILTGLDGEKYWVELDLNKYGKNIKLE